MRFDVRCENCIFFKGNVPSDLECANNDGSIWDPGQQACNNFRGEK